MPGLSGHVSADPVELERWRDGVEHGQPWWIRARFRAYCTVLLPLLMAVGLAYNVWFHHGNRERVPSSYRIEWNELVVLDAARTEMWRKTFREPIDPGTGTLRHSIRPPVGFWDVDQDGHKEVLFVQEGADFSHDVVFCYSRGGSELWHFDPPAADESGRDLQNTVTNVVLAGGTGTGGGSPGSGPILFVVTCSLPAHKGRLLALDAKGKSAELFRQEGHLDRVEMADVDLDGVSEIIAGGFDAQRHQANLHLLHPPARTGAPAELEAEVFFPRTALNLRLADQNRVSRLTARPGYLQASTLEWLDEDRHEVCYLLDSQLRPHAWFCDPFPALRHRPLTDCAQPVRSEAAEIAELRDSVEVVRHAPIPAARP